jgi:hypothetical protein
VSADLRAKALEACGTGNAEVVAWMVGDVRRDAGDRTADELIRDLARAGYAGIAAQLTPPGGVR